MYPRRIWLTISFIVASLTPCCAQTKYALLIGIDTYQPANTTVRHPDKTSTGRFAPGVPTFPNLKGPTYDVESMRLLLTSAKFGFLDDGKHVHLLENQAATRAGMLSAMNLYLVEQPQKGDIVVLYIASHGSLRVNSKSEKQVFDIEGKSTPLDNTIVPADAYLGAEDIRDRELARIFNKALDKGIRLTAIFDTCHSGGTARGAAIGPRAVARMIAYDPRDIAEAPDTNPDGTPITAPEDRKDNAALVLAATQPDQTAKELPDSSPPHGVFTKALVDALQELPADIPALDLWKRVQIDLEIQGFSDQQPVLDGTRSRKQQPIFGLGNADDKGKVRASVVRADEDGIVLDIGSISDIGIGSEFKTLANSAPVTLQVTGAIGITRSVAVASPAGAKVTPKQLYELTKWIPPDKPGLTFWTPPSNLTDAQIAAAITALRSTGLHLIEDPSLEPWTHLISWNGAQWTLQRSGIPGSTPLGTSLTADALQQQNIPPQATVWLNLPPSAELAAQLQLNDPHSAAKSTPDQSQAMYLLAGTATAGGPAYTWYNRSELIAGHQTPLGYGKGCSPDSSYPIRTNWVSSTATTAAEPAASLKELAVKLAKLNGWLQLQSTVTGDSDYPYHLALQRISDGAIAEDKASTYNNDHYQLLLQARGDTRTSPRWVYVLGIDCQGNGQLLFPQTGGGDRYPQQSGRLDQIPLPGTKFHISAPFGADTYVLLTTSTALPDPDVLNFAGVVQRGGSAGTSPLAALLSTTSAGTRGATQELPIDWSIEYLQLRSNPTTAVTTPNKSHDAN